jgi:hypothetical protein
MPDRDGGPENVECDGDGDDGVCNLPGSQGNDDEGQKRAEVRVDVRYVMSGVRFERGRLRFSCHTP